MLIPPALRFGSIKIYNEIIYFEEGRPKQGGKTFLLSFDPKTDTSTKEVLPENTELRTKVNEYGGCSFEVAEEGVYFVEKSSNQVWFCSHNKELKQITHSSHRFAELCRVPFGLVAVEERVYAEESSHTGQRLVLISLEDGSITQLHFGADFYSNPTFQNGLLSFLIWRHPHMPWGENELWQATLTPQGLKEPRALLKEPGVSYFGPQYRKNGSLLFASDKSGYWNLYQFEAEQIAPLTSLQIEIGYPQWVFGLSCFSEKQDKIHWIGCDNAIWKKGTLDPKTKQIEYENSPMTYFAQQRSGDTVEAWIESSYNTPSQIVCRQDAKSSVVIRSSLSGDLPKYASPESLDGTFSNRKIQGFFYATEESNQNKPAPLLIRCHGGPTAMSSNSYDPKIAFWLRKGFSVFDINYTGSCGFGRHFRQLLNGHWGEFDWKDCLHWAEEFIKRGLAQKDAIFISGSSAGGFTALCAAARSTAFAGATSYYGISNLVTLHKTTHRFESHYDQTLIGRFSESKKLYEKRSPIYYLEDWQTPTLFLQGEEDKVVPPDQSMELHDALLKQGVKTAIKIYPEEGHGFRKYENQLDSLEREYRFYNEILLSKKPRS